MGHGAVSKRRYHPDTDNLQQHRCENPQYSTPHHHCKQVSVWHLGTQCLFILRTKSNTRMHCIDDLPFDSTLKEVVNAVTNIFENIISQTVVRLPLLVRQPLFYMYVVLIKNRNIEKDNLKSKYNISHTC
jgi:hypothetical protein